jgi:hypothetical protein
MTPTTPLGVALARSNERLRRAFGRSRPLPRVAADLRTPVPAWALRAAQLAVVFACVAVGAPNSLGWLVGFVLGGLMVALPRPIWTGLFAVWGGVVVLLAAPDPFQPTTFALLFGVHLLAVLTATVDRVPLGARVELSVLFAPGRRFLVVQGFSQALALIAAWVTAADVSAVWVAVAAGALVAMVMWVLVARLNRVAKADADEWD